MAAANNPPDRKGLIVLSWVWVGAPVIIGSGLVIVWREHRLSRRAALSASAASPT